MRGSKSGSGGRLAAALAGRSLASGGSEGSGGRRRSFGGGAAGSLGMSFTFFTDRRTL